MELCNVLTGINHCTETRANPRGWKHNRLLQQQHTVQQLTGRNSCLATSDFNTSVLLNVSVHYSADWSEEPRAGLGHKHIAPSVILRLFVVHCGVLIPAADGRKKQIRQIKRNNSETLNKSLTCELCTCWASKWSLTVAWSPVSGAWLLLIRDVKRGIYDPIERNRFKFKACPQHLWNFLLRVFPYSKIWQPNDDTHPGKKSTSWSLFFQWSLVIQPLKGHNIGSGLVQLLQLGCSYTLI